MKPLKWLLFVLCLLTLFSCKQNKSNPNSTVTPSPEQTFIDTTEVAVDSTFIIISRIISDELMARNLTFKIEESGDDTQDSLIVYKYRFDNDSYTCFRLDVQEFATESTAKQEMANLKVEKQRMIQTDQWVKIGGRYWRIGNKVYFTFSTSNISHIEVRVYNRIISELKIEDADTEIL